MQKKGLAFLTKVSRQTCFSPNLWVLHKHAEATPRHPWRARHSLQRRLLCSHVASFIKKCASFFSHFASIINTPRPLQTHCVLRNNSASFVNVTHPLQTVCKPRTRCWYFARTCRSSPRNTLPSRHTHLHLIILQICEPLCILPNSPPRRIQQCSHLNQMPSEKLACVFSSCLFQTRGQTPQEAGVVRDLISNYISLFSVSARAFLKCDLGRPGRGLAIVSLAGVPSCCVIGGIFSYVYGINSQQLHSTPAHFAQLLPLAGPSLNEVSICSAATISCQI